MSDCSTFGDFKFDRWFVVVSGLGRSPWRRERLPTAVFWPGELHGLYSPWGCKVRHD